VTSPLVSRVGGRALPQAAWHPCGCGGNETEVGM